MGQFYYYLLRANGTEISAALWAVRLGKDFTLFTFTLAWFMYVNDWVKKCMEYEVEGARPKKTWREIVGKDCQVRSMNVEDVLVIVDG